MAINLNTAKALGLTTPRRPVLLRADRVIEMKGQELTCLAT